MEYRNEKWERADDGGKSGRQKQLLLQCHSWPPSGVFRPLKSPLFHRQLTPLRIIPLSLSLSISPCITHILLFSSVSQFIWNVFPPPRLHLFLVPPTLTSSCSPLLFSTFPPTLKLRFINSFTVNHIQGEQQAEWKDVYPLFFFLSILIY